MSPYVAIDEIRITESVDCSTYESAGTQSAMGFGQDPETPGLAESVRREQEGVDRGRSDPGCGEFAGRPPDGAADLGHGCAPPTAAIRSASSAAMHDSMTGSSSPPRTMSRL